jgi:DNA-directed RNA polymerase subunit L
MAVTAKLTNLTVTSLRPNITDKTLDALIPKTLVAARCTFIVENVNNAVANAIRRTIMSEMPVTCLYCEYHNIVTDDPYIIPEIIQSRMKLIPVDQKISLTAVYELNAENSESRVIDVKLSKMSATGKPTAKLPFNETTTLFILQPGCKLSIKDIRPVVDYGYKDGCAGHTVAVNVVSLSKDQEPYNPYTKTGIPTSVANPRKWEIAFNTNGTMAPKDIISTSFKEIIARIRSVMVGVASGGGIERGLSEYSLVVNGESHTIGNLFVAVINDLYPGISAVTYFVSTTERQFTLRARCEEEFSTVLNTAANHIIEIFEKLMTFL